MKASRRLSDLFVRGREVTLNDGLGEPVTVWLQKLNPVDRESAFRRAQAAKARFMVDSDNEDGEAFQAMYTEARDVSDQEQLISVLIAEDLGKRRAALEAERAGDEESWGKDNYLQSLVDAWVGDDQNPGLAAVAAEDPDDPEAKRVLDEIERFEAEISEGMKDVLAQLKAPYEETPLDDLRRAVTHKLLEMRGNDVFGQEFERQELFFAVRQADDRHKRYFGTITEINDLDEKVIETLLVHFRNLQVELTEGKDLPAEPDSSTSSEPPSEAEVSPLSGHEVVTV